MGCIKRQTKKQLGGFPSSKSINICLNNKIKTQKMNQPTKQKNPSVNNGEKLTLNSNLDGDCFTWNCFLFLS